MLKIALLAALVGASCTGEGLNDSPGSIQQAAGLDCSGTCTPDLRWCVNVCILDKSVGGLVMQTIDKPEVTPVPVCGDGYCVGDEASLGKTFCREDCLRDPIAFELDDDGAMRVLRNGVAVARLIENRTEVLGCEPARE